jgi:hypothetical protein
MISCQVERLLLLPEKRCRRYTTILVGCADGAGELALRVSGKAAQRARHSSDIHSPAIEQSTIGRSRYYLQESNGLNRGVKDTKSQWVRCEVRVVQLDSPPTFLGRHQNYFQAWPKSMHGHFLWPIWLLVVDYAPIYPISHNTRSTSLLPCFIPTLPLLIRVLLSTLRSRNRDTLFADGSIHPRILLLPGSLCNVVISVVFPPCF